MVISARVQGYIRILFVLFILVSGYIYLVRGTYWIIAGVLKNPGLTDLVGQAAGHDFVAFWSAGALAARGDPAGVYSLEKMHAMEQAVIGVPTEKWAWNYPPTFLLMVLPLSFLPYLAALAAWVLLTLGGYLRLTYRIAPHRVTPWLFLGFPGVYDNLFFGQNGFLSAILLGGGLLWLDRRPFWAGCLFGLLTYKPQLVILIPVALLAGRRWRALAGAAAGGLGLALASLGLFGTGTWIAFWHNLPFASQLIEQSIYWGKMPTIYAAARGLGLSHFPCLLVQGVGSAGALLAVAWVWYRDFPLPSRASVLAIATFLATPYALNYDLAILGLAFAWLGWQEYREERANGQIFLILCWAACYLMTQKLGLQYGLQGTPLILVALLLFALRRAREAERSPGEARQPQTV
jgi:alpha-1,2-mannosyltransferase